MKAKGYDKIFSKECLIFFKVWRSNKREKKVFYFQFSFRLNCTKLNPSSYLNTKSCEGLILGNINYKFYIFLYRTQGVFFLYKNPTIHYSAEWKWRKDSNEICVISWLDLDQYRWCHLVSCQMGLKSFMPESSLGQST